MINIAIQKALIDHLKAYTPLMNKITGIYDYIPAESLIPYIQFGDITALGWDTDDSIGFNLTATLHTWTRETSRKTNKEIQDLIFSALHRSDLDIEGFSLVECEVIFQDCFVESDTITKHGLTRLRIVCEQL